MGMVAVLEENARVAREPRTDRAHQQHRCTEVAVAEVLPRLHSILE